MQDITQDTTQWLIGRICAKVERVGVLLNYLDSMLIHEQGGNFDSVNKKVSGGKSPMNEKAFDSKSELLKFLSDFEKSLIKKINKVANKMEMYAHNKHTKALMRPCHVETCYEQVYLSSAVTINKKTKKAKVMTWLVCEAGHRQTDPAKVNIAIYEALENG